MSQKPTRAYIWKENIILKDTCTPTFTVALLTIAKTWRQAKCPSREMDKGDVVYPYIQWSVIQPQKEGHDAICSIMD